MRIATLLLSPTLPGQRSPAARAAQERRDRLICVTIAEFFPALLAATAAEQLAERLARYRSGPDWKRDRTATSINYRQSLRGRCWEILKAVDRPLSGRRIREILATSSVSSSPRD
ncbi:hypothetical protein RX330_20435 [Bradyrhizobium sp. NDS-1]|uniref:hypothetical protein n=1 Tax=Bradyrhizobium sp. NDS-1 TaxID=3080014 RepID=UPI00293EBB66|nr:hypothetical protein [Bradyrhizobium sp. NDS-1]WOH70667.1 hypothetical protein RX330_20435 [Bradyrhizobium sp. NDS-1]